MIEATREYPQYDWLYQRIDRSKYVSHMLIDKRKDMRSAAVAREIVKDIWGMVSASASVSVSVSVCASVSACFVPIAGLLGLLELRLLDARQAVTCSLDR